jgi:ATP-dependent protease ClpP protease subunit
MARESRHRLKFVSLLPRAKGVGEVSTAVMVQALGRALWSVALAFVVGIGGTRAEVATYGSGLILRRTMTEQDADILSASLPQNGTLFLSSPGGSLAAGLRIASLANARRITVVVEADCVSACSLPFFAAARRVMKPGTRVGVHSSSRVDGHEDDETLATTARIVRILAGHGVPQTVVAGMMTATPDKVYWLTNRELTELGVERTIVSSETKFACGSYRIEAAAGFGRIRSAPSLSAPVVQQLANGSRIENCGESRTDERGVVWLDVTVASRDEAGQMLEARGWVSRLVLSR